MKQKLAVVIAGGIPIVLALVAYVNHVVHNKRNESRVPAAEDNLVIPRAELCANPAKYLCSPKVNPFIAPAMKAPLDFDDLKRRLWKEQCGGLSLSACNRKIAKPLGDLLFTEDRKAKAGKLFKLAQKAVEEFLAAQKRYFQGQKTELKILDKMIDQVHKTELRFGLYDETDGYEFNAERKFSIPKSEQRWHNFFTNADMKNVIYLQGVVLYVDQTPWTLLATMLHEFGHVIGPRRPEFRKGSNYSGNPFQKELECLRHESSVGVKQAMQLVLSVSPPRQKTKKTSHV